MFYFPFHSPTNEYYNVDSISEYFSVCPRTHVCVCVCIPHSPLEVLFPITGTLPVLSGPAIICGWAFNDCMCVCVSFRIRSAIVAIRENLWVHIQCICRFACFSRHGRIHGTCVCVCVRLCVWGYCLYRLLVLMFRSVLACVNMKLFGSVHAIAMLYIIVCMCAFPRTV